MYQLRLNSIYIKGSDCQCMVVELRLQYYWEFVRNHLRTIRRFYSAYLRTITRFYSAYLRTITRFYSAYLRPITRFHGAYLRTITRFYSAYLRTITRFYSVYLFSKSANSIIKILIDCIFWVDDFENQFYEKYSKTTKKNAAKFLQ